MTPSNVLCQIHPDALDGHLTPFFPSPALWSVAGLSGGDPDNPILQQGGSLPAGQLYALYRSRATAPRRAICLRAYCPGIDGDFQQPFR